MKIYVISLLRSLDRRKRISSQLEQLGVDFEFFDAVDGSQGEHVLWADYNYLKRKWLISGKKPSSGELGCFASHYLIWQKCVENNAPVLVIEDDAFIRSNFAEQFPSIRNCLKEFDFLRLESEIKGCKVTPIKGEPHSSIGFMTDNSGGTRSYALTPSAAKKLLSGSTRWCMPVDNYIGAAYIHQVASFIYKPAVVVDTNEFGTTIQLGEEQKAPNYIKLSRELYQGYCKFRMHIFNRKQVRKFS
ncbi:glycosyltransferase family 25 protein [Vibrio sp. ER1A]|uniref:glycosyltransferase family 25 protein n=1 Tax=Vibrio sp. ER1A TaxID=1517681 RepID=UPI0004DD5795|nr:glycosyltransferase family 25 protein [Vibrio sp. ER1A]KFA95191.1 glycosyl transferase [Vibrio sp. ER1A]